MIRILIADDERLIRDAISGLLELEDDFEVVARAASGEEAIREALRHRPDIALLDLQMPEPDGIEVSRQLSTALPACRCIIVTSHGRPGYLKSALAVGVMGFLPKTVSAQTLAQVVRSVMDGGRHIDTDLATEAVGAGDSPLTPREADVLGLAREGAPVGEIAQRISLSPGTVRNYLASAIAKLGATNRHEAVHLASRQGWI
ncbi:DNA-binding response regulator [Mycetocola lacteus]|uniref:DNA-binding response regulator n=1 Tax=Mycetocola lacteus TaxID=76637 RepID=A0A3L7AH45_9MICO|nr:response regulator transcription factor [Mycetocola lacteus]RLP79803.1 DNA-binding response regulator [Mycetocola lacteus]